MLPTRCGCRNSGASLSRARWVRTYFTTALPQTPGKMRPSRGTTLGGAVLCSFW